MRGQADKDCTSPEVQYCRAIFEQSSDAIISSLSHELRTPLSAIIGLSELLERQNCGPLTESQRVYVQGIQTSGWLMYKLVCDIVDLSRIEAGKLSLSRDWTSLDLLAEAALGDIQALADRKRIALRVRLQPDLPKVWVDPVRMQQVLSKLVASAINFTPQGGAVGLTACEDRTNICISVTNAGIGTDATGAIATPPEVLMEDAGLGLALANRLLEMHGGRIHVLAEAGGAFTVTGTFPVNQQDEKDWINAA